VLSTTRGSIRRNKSPKEPARLEDKKHVDAGQGRKGSPAKELEKRILFASKASESLRNLESEILGSTDGVRRDSSPRDKRSVRSKDTTRMEPGPTKPGRSNARRNDSPEDSIPAMSKDSEHADGMGKKDSPGKKSEKRTLFVSQTEEASESLRYPESNESTSEDSVTQGRTESSDRYPEPVINNSTMERMMAKGCIETVGEVKKRCGKWKNADGNTARRSKDHQTYTGIYYGNRQTRYEMMKQVWVVQWMRAG
jgi:hypothetical protein